MPHPSQVFALVLALVGSGAVSCASKDATGPNIGLSQEEIYGLGAELGSALNSPAFASVQPGPIDVSVNCPLGGSYTVTGTYGGDTTAAGETLTADVTATYHGCRTGSFTTSGPVHLTASSTSTATAATVQAAAKGTLGVTTSDGRSGSCVIDVTAIASATQTAPMTTTVAGAACGMDVGGTY
jgi:hypothetical protein